MITENEIKLNKIVSKLEMEQKRHPNPLNDMYEKKPIAKSNWISIEHFSFSDWG